MIVVELIVFFFLRIRRPPRSTRRGSAAASDVYKRQVSDGPTSVAPAAAAQALEDLAELHVRYEDPTRRAAEAAWVPPPMTGGDYGDVRLRYGLDHHRDRLSTHFAAIAELYLAKRQAFHALWDLSLIHL